MNDSATIAAALTAAVAEINRPTTVGETLDAIARAARDSMPGIDHVGVTLASRGAPLQTGAATDDLVHEIDAVQFGAHEGPCVDAVESGTGDLVVLEHVRHSSRYPGFAAGAASLGLRSSAAIRLFTGDRTVGVLNLYSTSSDTLDPETRTLAELFAVHASFANGHRHQVTHLQHAIESRELVGNAVGIVMERYGLSRARAFEYLVRVSATTETKLRVVAEQLVGEFERERPRG